MKKELAPETICQTPEVMDVLKFIRETGEGRFTSEAADLKIVTYERVELQSQETIEESQGEVILFGVS
jgi:hypothetical protein